MNPRLRKRSADSFGYNSGRGIAGNACNPFFLTQRGSVKEDLNMHAPLKTLNKRGWKSYLDETGSLGASDRTLLFWSGFKVARLKHCFTIHHRQQRADIPDLIFGTREHIL